MKTAIAIALVGLLLGACAKDKTSSTSQPRIVSAAAPEQEAMFTQIKALSGKWSVKGSDANMKGEIQFAVSSNDSIVRETMFPGTPHEMTNVYHLDGPSVVMTHYCAMGNQPRMRATTGDKSQIAFHCDSVTNMTTRRRDVHGRDDPDLQGQGPRDRDSGATPRTARWPPPPTSSN